MKETRKWKKTTIACVLSGLTAIPVADAIADGGKGKHKGKFEAELFAPEESVSGMSQGDWGAAWWQWVLSIPDERNPVNDKNGSLCAEGQGPGPVFFLAGTWVDLDNEGRTCTVTKGQSLFFPLINTECSEAEDGTDWYCSNEAECRECANRNADGFNPKSLKLIVDGKHFKGLEQHRFQSAAYNFTLPENNILLEDETESISVADGYWVTIKPLSPGEHKIYFYAETYPDDEGETWSQEVKYTITVE